MSDSTSGMLAKMKGNASDLNEAEEAGKKRASKSIPDTLQLKPAPAPGTKKEEKMADVLQICMALSSKKEEQHLP